MSGNAQASGNPLDQVEAHHLFPATLDRTDPRLRYPTDHLGEILLRDTGPPPVDLESSPKVTFRKRDGHIRALPEVGRRVPALAWHLRPLFDHIYWCGS